MKEVDFQLNYEKLKIFLALDDQIFEQELILLSYDLI